MILKKHVNYLISIFILTCSTFAFGQSRIVPQITARVDTTNIVKKKVYNLFKDYVNSKPDSLYMNPYWNKKEEIHFLKLKQNFNVGISSMLHGYKSAVQFYQYYPPKVLSIIKIDSARYSIRILYALSPSILKDKKYKQYKQFSPLYITKLYAVKDSSSNFVLSNLRSYDTKKWKRYSYNFIHYFVSPNCTFNKKEAKKAVQFCKNLAQKFDIHQIKDFNFYVTNNSEDLGKLYNYTYWLQYTKGFTNTITRDIFTSYGIVSYPHEFVHMILSPLIQDNNRTTMLINEGLATWQAGPQLNKTFKSALASFSKEIEKNDTLTLNDIIENKYRHPYDNIPKYVAGAVICKLVYEKEGTHGIKTILNLNMKALKKELQTIFDKSSWKQVGDLVMEFIKNPRLDN